MQTIDEEIASELAWGETLDDEGYSYKAKQHVEDHRWFTSYLIVFEHNGETYGFYYNEPASELQEDQERFDADPVPVFPVTGREIVQTVYEKA